MASPSSPVLNSELVVALDSLKLGRMADTLPERLVLADKQEMTFDDLLLLVLTDEIARRDNTAAELRVSEARLDPAMRLETWDKTSKVSFDKRMLAELTSLRFLEAHRHVVVLGHVGVGKTFVSQALGHIACRHGYHVHFTRADEMLRKLRQSRLDNSRDAEMIELTSVDMLIVDDFALEPMTKEETGDVELPARALLDVGPHVVVEDRRVELFEKRTTGCRPQHAYCVASTPVRSDAFAFEGPSGCTAGGSASLHAATTGSATSETRAGSGLGIIPHVIEMRSPSKDASVVDGRTATRSRSVPQYYRVEMTLLRLASVTRPGHGSRHAFLSFAVAWVVFSCEGDQEFERFLEEAVPMRPSTLLLDVTTVA